MTFNNLILFFQHEPFMFLLLVGIFSLLIGSFLNVVIWRLPLMLKAEWTTECLEFLSESKLIDKPAHFEKPKKLNLWHPRSHCPQCNKNLRIWDNIPIISYVFLKGRCSNCQNMIPLRYPFIEIFCCILSVVTAFYWGVSVQTICALILTWSLISLTWIDIDHQLLPDNITLPMLWLGLAININNVFTDPVSSLIGAMAGYMFLWVIFWIFKITTGKEGMGYGDFKLTALLGAWLGWQALPEIILIASSIGAICGVGMIFMKKIARSQPIPFGPYLAMAGWISLNWGDKLRGLYLGSIGLT
jgi:leader peptidase (prepilin peptidase)/N-methyltransferase